MPRSAILVLSSVPFLAAAAAAQAPPPPAVPAVVFENVTVVPMDSERVLPGYTVVVQGRRIAAVAPAGAVTAPAGATRVEGRARFLMPGLAEMHGHFPGPQAIEALGEQYADRMLFLSLANGVTTVRGMLGGPRDLQVRAEIASGQRLGPQVFVASPSINGTSVTDAESAWRAVSEARAAGYDLLKIHPGVRRAPFDEVVAVAQREGIPFAGHVPAEVGLTRALISGMATVEHLDGYIEALVPEGTAPAGPAGFFGFNLIDHVDEGRIPDLAAATRAAGAWNTPTQTLFDNVLGGEAPERLAQRPEMRYMPPQVLKQWAETTRTMAGQGLVPEKARRYLDVRRKIIRALRDAGAGLLLGADTPQVYNVPGFATLHELEALVASGLTPYQALRAGTHNPAAYLGLAGSFGTVEKGKRADLLLLEANPLDDVKNVYRRVGVMAAGRWLTAAEIDERLRAIAQP